MTDIFSGPEYGKVSYSRFERLTVTYSLHFRKPSGILKVEYFLIRCRRMLLTRDKCLIADIVKMIDSQPDLAPLIRRVRGGYLKIQGTWMPYEVSLGTTSRIVTDAIYLIIRLLLNYHEGLLIS
jgi:hypothetical protein